MPTNNQSTRTGERSSTANTIPSSIITALSKQQDKLYILHLERDLIKFIKNSILGNIKQPEYIIQAQYLKNSYYRLLSHQLCQYYCLQHWNNTFNEIIVTPTLNFNYQELIEKIENSEDNEQGEFVKVSSVAHKYKSDTSNNNESSDPNIKPSPIKKLMVRKIISKSSTNAQLQIPSTPESEISDITKELDESKLILEDTGLSTPISDSSENTTSNIESQRASKEALYMRLREEIFENNNDDDDEEEEDEEEEEEEEEDDDKDDSYNNSPRNANYPDNGRNYVNYGNYKMPYQQPPLQQQQPMYPSIPIPIQYQYPNQPPTNAAVPGMVYNPYFQPMVYGYPPNFAGSNSPGSIPKYDKETERRILNNPYIIIPDENKNTRNTRYNSHKHKKQYANSK